MKKSLLKLALGIFTLTFGGSSFAQTYTFTNCGATGQNGPTQGQVNATYTGANTLTGAVTINTQGIQEWTVPVTGNYRIEVIGAQGGSANYVGTDGGLGARMIGDFNLTNGSVLKVLVGQQGGSEAAGGGGGGGSFVVTSTNIPLIIAGAGGGGNGNGSSRGDFIGGNGLIGTTAGNSDNYGNPAYGSPAPGVGGGQPSEGGTMGYGGGGGVAGGGGGFYDNGGIPFWGQSGIGFLNGGNGGNGNGTINHGGFGGGGGGAISSGYGGGGGGYSGGGGGGLTPTNTFHGNGGGGGSYNTGINQSNTAGYNTGMGQVIITLLCNPLVLNVTPNDTVCLGTPVTINGTSTGTGTITWDNSISNNVAFPNPTAGSTTYTSSSTDPNDCVSQVTINVLPALVGSVTTTICNEDTVMVNGTAYYSGNPSGTEVFSNIGPFNCDSTVTVNLNVLPALTGSVTTTICNNGSVIVNGTTYNAGNPSGTEVFTNVGPNMCDSTVTVNLNVLAVKTGSVTTTICNNGSVVVNGTTYNAGNPTGTEVFTNVGPFNCDSTVTVNLNVLAVKTGSVTNTICNEDTIMVNGTAYYSGNTSGTEVFTNVGPNNCDSTVTVNLTVLALKTGTVTDTICANDSRVINGTTYNAGNPTGTEIFTNVGPNMCDSTVTVNLTVNALPTVAINPFNPDSVCVTDPTFTLPVGTPAGGTYSGTGVVGANFDPNAAGVGSHYVVYSYTDSITTCTNMDSTLIVVESCVGIDEANGLVGINIYPNPANNVINVSLGEITTAVNFTLTSIDGKVVYNLNNVNDNKVAIDISNNSKGVYFLKIETNNQQQIFKVIKQ